MKHIYLSVLILLSVFAGAQTFQTVPAGFLNCSQGGQCWGDFDNDGDLDVALSGYTDNYVPFVAIYRNKNGNFQKLDTQMPGLTLGSVYWGDFDNDNDLDLLVCGTDPIGDGRTFLYRNDNGTFTDISAGFTGIVHGEAIWMDYNNDGWLDVLISGDTLYNSPVTRLYRNNSNGTFNAVAQNIPGFLEGCIDAGDYDNDGDQDIFISGTVDTGFATFIYRNINGVFENSGLQFFPIAYCDGHFIDYDSDGDMDLIYMGSTLQADYRVKIYRNDGNNGFTCSSDSLDGEWVGRIDAADINNDGYPDLGITGALCCGDALTKIYLNDGNGHFNVTPVALPDLYFSNIQFGDFDNDGDADFLLSGIPPDGPGNVYTALYRNMSMTNTYTPNTPPTAPSGLISSVDVNDVTISWDAASDNTTPESALCYSLRMGTTPGGEDVVSPLSDPASGFSRVYGHGNAWQHTSRTIRDLSAGRYYCAVQAIDQSGTASDFSSEYSFDILVNGTENVEDQPFSIYPNPAKDIVTIQTVFPGTITTEISDLTGKVIMKSSFSSIGNLNIKDLPAGLYVVKMVAGEKTFQQLVIKQ